MSLFASIRHFCYILSIFVYLFKGNTIKPRGSGNYASIMPTQPLSPAYLPRPSVTVHSLRQLPSTNTLIFEAQTKVPNCAGIRHASVSSAAPISAVGESFFEASAMYSEHSALALASPQSVDRYTVMYRPRSSQPSFLISNPGTRLPVSAITLRMHILLYSTTMRWYNVPNG